jgi:hypothetical protein
MAALTYGKNSGFLAKSPMLQTSPLSPLRPKQTLINGTSTNLERGLSVPTSAATGEDGAGIASETFGGKNTSCLYSSVFTKIATGTACLGTKHE